MKNPIYKLNLWWHKFPHKKTLYVSTALWLILLLMIAIAIGFRIKHRNEPYIVGVSYSLKAAESLGINNSEALAALLDDLEIRNFRLMSYWDIHEAQRNIYNFSELDTQMDAVAQRNGTVSLAIGARQPRWPECHAPTWSASLDQKTYQAELLEYIEVVVERYKHHPALQSWQLENEALLKSFGVCPEPDRDLLNREYQLVSSLDTEHPIIMSQSNQYGLPLRPPKPDVYGFSVYKRIHEGRLLNRVITHPMPAWYHSFRAGTIELFKRQPVIIHELQMEPWGGRATQDLSIDEQNESMSVSQIDKNFEFAKKTGIKTMYLWGSEWWYWRATHHNDSSIWEAVRFNLDQAR